MALDGKAKPFAGPANALRADELQTPSLSLASKKNHFGIQGSIYTYHTYTYEYIHNMYMYTYMYTYMHACQDTYILAASNLLS